MTLIERLAGRDELSHIVSCLDRNAHFAFSLTCKAAHNAVLSIKEPIKTTYVSIASSISFVEWAINMGCPVKCKIWLDEVAMKGNLEMMIWLCETHACEWNYCDAAKNAALHEHIRLLVWAHENNKYLASVYIYAAYAGHISVIEWALEKNIGVGDDDTYDKACVTCAAAEGGQIETLEWLRNNGFEWENLTCSGAAKGGHLDVLKWLRSEGCPWNNDVYMQAAKNGYIDIVKWAYANGLTSESSNLCEYAAREGNLEMLQWARENGFEWGRYTMWWGALYNHLPILKWAYANGCVCSYTRSNRLRMFTSTVSWEIIMWVEDNLGLF